MAAEPNPAPPQIPSTSDDRTLAVVCHLGGIMTSALLPSLIWMLKKEESRFVDDQGKEAMHFQLTLLVGYFAAFVLSAMPYIGFLGGLMIVVFWLGGTALSVLAAMAANRGNLFRYPLNLGRMIQQWQARNRSSDAGQTTPVRASHTERSAVRKESALVTLACPRCRAPIGLATNPAPGTSIKCPKCAQVFNTPGGAPRPAAAPRPAPAPRPAAPRPPAPSVNPRPALPAPPAPPRPAAPRPPAPSVNPAPAPTAPYGAPRPAAPRPPAPSARPAAEAFDPFADDSPPAAAAFDPFADDSPGGSQPSRPGGKTRPSAPVQPKKKRGFFFKACLSCGCVVLLFTMSGVGAAVYFLPKLKQEFENQLAALQTAGGTAAFNTAPTTEMNKDSAPEPRKDSGENKTNPEATPPPVDDGKIDPLAYVVDDSNLIVGIDFTALLGVPMIKDAVENGLKMNAAKMVEEIKRDTGLEVQDLVGRVYVSAIVAVPEGGTPPTPPNIATIVIRSQKPIRYDLLAKSPYIERTLQVQGKKYYQLKKDSPLGSAAQDTAFLYLPTDRVLVFADLEDDEMESLVKLDGTKSAIPSEQEKMVRRLEKNALWVLSPFNDETKTFVNTSLTAVSGLLPPEVGTAVKAADQVKAAALWVSLGPKQMTIAAGLQCATEKGAGEMSAGLEGYWNKFKGPFMDQLKPVMSKLPAELGTLVTDGVGSVKFSKQDDWSQVSLELGLQPVEALAKKIQTEGPGLLMKALQELPMGGPTPMTGGGEQQLLELVNFQRMEAKLPPLKINPTLSKLARDYAAVMAKEGKLEDNLDGKTFQQRLDASMYKYSGAVPLTATEPNGKAAEVVIAWLKNDEAKKHLLGKYADCGIGVAAGAKGGVYYYLVLAAPNP